MADIASGVPSRNGRSAQTCGVRVCGNPDFSGAVDWTERMLWIGGHKYVLGSLCRRAILL